MNASIRLARASLLMAGLLTLAGCAGLKVAAAPLTVVRDVVDAPLVSVTNAFEYFADNTRPAKTPHAGVGWSLSGPSLGIGYDISHFLFKGASGIFGAVDYVVCRSVWPNFPEGVSPWKKEEQSWGDLYFPSTKALF
jgi:hypothetical protein